MSKKKFRLEFLYRPGERLHHKELCSLVAELRETAVTCFNELPDYQCLRGTREELSTKVISVARTKSGEMAGFCSMAVFTVPGVGNVLHAGLTCVKPAFRKSGLTHQLSSKAIVSYLFRKHPVGRLWITNVACVLSSLGNIALHAENVHPSPFVHEASPDHLKIAAYINQHCRDQIYIRPEAEFDPVRFVFRGSVENTMFQKDEEDARYHHRNRVVNDYYRYLMDFERGDEVLQIGQVSLLIGAKHRYFRKSKQAVPALVPANDIEKTARAS